MCIGCVCFCPCRIAPLKFKPFTVLGSFGAASAKSLKAIKVRLQTSIFPDKQKSVLHVLNNLGLGCRVRVSFRLGLGVALIKLVEFAHLNCRIT